MLIPREKSPLLEGWTHNTASRRTVSPTHYWLSYCQANTVWWCLWHLLQHCQCRHFKISTPLTITLCSKHQSQGSNTDTLFYNWGHRGRGEAGEGGGGGRGRETWNIVYKYGYTLLIIQEWIVKIATNCSPSYIYSSLPADNDRSIQLRWI